MSERGIGIYEDRATTFLGRVGYNVVRQAIEGIEPLALIGKQGATRVPGPPQ